MKTDCRTPFQQFSALVLFSLSLTFTDPSPAIAKFLNSFQQFTLRLHLLKVDTSNHHQPTLVTVHISCNICRI